MTNNKINSGSFEYTNSTTHVIHNHTSGLIPLPSEVDVVNIAKTQTTGSGNNLTWLYNVNADDGSVYGLEMVDRNRTRNFYGSYGGPPTLTNEFRDECNAQYQLNRYKYAPGKVGDNACRLEAMNKALDIFYAGINLKRIK